MALFEPEPEVADQKDAGSVGLFNGKKLSSVKNAHVMPVRENAP